MSDLAMNGFQPDATHDPRPNLNGRPHALGEIVFLVVLAAGLAYAAFSIVSDVNSVGEHTSPLAPWCCSASRC